jgi:magnesium-transporting ATPase (P-type)
MMKLHNTIIYIIGIQAVGKYTTAKEIARLTGAKRKDIKDNRHKLIKLIILGFIFIIVAIFIISLIAQ